MKILDYYTNSITFFKCKKNNPDRFDLKISDYFENFPNSPLIFARYGDKGGGSGSGSACIVKGSYCSW